MMSTNPGSTSAANSSDNWHQAPPHVAANLSTATQFASARTRLGDALSSASGARSVSPNPGIREQGGFNPPGRIPSPMPSGSPAPSMSSPLAPTGLMAKVITDTLGNTFFIKGRGPTPSNESDLPDTHTAEDSNTNTHLASLTEAMTEVPLTPGQEGTFNQMCSAIALDQEQLFATTSLAVETQDKLHNDHEELQDFKLEVTRWFEELHKKLDSHHTQLNN
ncbi:hypothetical protein K438DRAFT_2072688 [Mycena galopus ATCC 62051]|nr:hypothetical protein K438DRAFT_2072688 [Mycena galopus ATCC 62051]